MPSRGPQGASGGLRWPQGGPGGLMGASGSLRGPQVAAGCLRGPQVASGCPRVPHGASGGHHTGLRGPQGASGTPIANFHKAAMRATRGYRTKRKGVQQIRNSKLSCKTVNSQETHDAISSNLLLLLLLLLLVPLLLRLGRRAEVGGAGKARRAYKI